MHAECRRWVESCLLRICQPSDGGRVLDIGSHDVNGTSRDLFGPDTFYYGIDIRPGPGVDEVCDARNLPAHLEASFNLVICTEVLEHTPGAGRIVRSAYDALLPGGALILTTAWEGRAPHSAVDGGALRRTRDMYKMTGIAQPPQRLEWYANVSTYELVQWLRPFASYTIDTLGPPACDIRALAWKDGSV